MSAVDSEAPVTIDAALIALREGRLRATELVEGALRAGHDAGERLGIYVARFDEPARAAALGAEAAYAAGGEPLVLQGIPLGVKDNVATIDGPTTAQSLVLDPAWAEEQGDATAVARLRAAGGIVCGKNTTMEFATGIPDPSKPFPLPRNPWNAEHWAGGSSSGTASGVSVGAFLGGLGTDTGGSVRIPAAYCGITGLKPTFGRVPKSGVVPFSHSLDHVGPMARTARDCALLLGVLAGHDPRDLTSVDEPVEDYVAALTGDVSDLRIGVDPLRRVCPDRDQEVDSAFAAAVETLAQLGATVIDVEIPWYNEVAAANRITSRSEALAYHLPDLRSRWFDYFDSTRQGVGAGAFFTGADYVQAQRVRRVAQGAVADLFTAVDLVVTPTTSAPAPRLDRLIEHGWRMELTHTNYWNVVGNPALAVPMGHTRLAMPLSLQIIGRPFDEASVLRAGDAYQQNTGWHGELPLSERG